MRGWGPSQVFITLTKKEGHWLWECRIKQRRKIGNVPRPNEENLFIGLTIIDMSHVNADVY